MRARRQSVEAVIAKLLEEWYLPNNFYTPPREMCEDSKSYKGRVLRWFEPKPALAEVNAIMIEEYVGDHWTIRIVEDR